MTTLKRLVAGGDTRQVRRFRIASTLLCLALAFTLGTATAASPGRSRSERSLARATRGDHGHSGRRKDRVPRHRRHRRVHRHRRPASSPRLSDAEPTGSEAGDSSPVEPTASLPQIEPGETPSRLLWSDEFNGPEGAAPDPSKWNSDVGGNGWGNDELQSYTARRSNASLDGNGDLAITARAERYRGSDGVGRDYTSARLQTLEKVEFTYGLLEARIEVPAGQGLAPAFWTLGNEAYEGDEGEWPQCGEIDAMEVLGSEPEVLNGTLHGRWPSAPNGLGREFRSPTPLSAGFHVYGARWEPDRVTFLLDGSPYATFSKEDLPAGDVWPFQHPNFILLNLAVGGDWPGSPDPSTQFPARMLVDWVRIYQ